MLVDNPPISVSDALDNYIAQTRDEREPDGYYHPSSMWLCDRATILAVRGVVVSHPADALAKRTFEIGHLMHRLVQDSLMPDLGAIGPGPAPGLKAFYPEFKITVPKWNVTGHGDGLLVCVNDDAWVLEIKSTKSLRYTPSENHEKQASVYTVAAADHGFTVDGDNGGYVTLGGYSDGPLVIGPLGDRVKGLILVYLLKNTMEMKEYVIPFKKSWRTQIEKKVAELDRYRDYGKTKGTLVELSTLPPPLPLDKGKPNWYTGYCNYKGSGLCCGDPEREADFDW
jgi:hypothetical protein